MKCLVKIIISGDTIAQFVNAVVLLLGYIEFICLPRMGLI